MAGKTIVANSGVIFDIQRFALHDGPGIRTIVFMKGCPLRCGWCSNPESQRFGTDLMFYAAKCTSCLACVEACPFQAISRDMNGRISINRWLCESCSSQLCVQVCPTSALQVAGRTSAVEEILAEVARDKAFYESSGGGVTFSGGEPLAQESFLFALLRASREMGIDTAVETCAFADAEDVRIAAALADHFLCDVKHMDSDSHRAGTGVDNARVLSNIALLAKLCSDVVLRIPLVPGFNDSLANISAACEFARELGIQRMDLLPYHRLGESKYRALGRDYEFLSVPKPQDTALQRLRELVLGYGIECEIGG